ncbi:chemotaxis protein CheW [Aestuariibacter salexigens]|uniref:chemotaxis protein CheW n=1 Tax=Aestuariibacter salexigens TaxID=226010 RepID=UPI000403CE1F|nr:chemotaxis protein CheW [Aestuariibacter salexigens]
MMHQSADSLELLNLNVSNESFAMHITDVQEIRVLEGLRRMPNAPDCWLGVIDFRDHMIPLIDLRLVFGARENPITDKTVVVVVQITLGNTPRLVGLVVDAVSDVMSIAVQKIKTPPDMNDSSKSVVAGVFKHNDHIVLLLDLINLVSAKDFDKIQSQLSVVSDGVE